MPTLQLCLSRLLCSTFMRNFFPFFDMKCPSQKKTVFLADLSEKFHNISLQWCCYCAYFSESSSRQKCGLRVLDTIRLVKSSHVNVIIHSQSILFIFEINNISFPGYIMSNNVLKIVQICVGIVLLWSAQVWPRSFQPGSAEFRQVPFHPLTTQRRDAPLLLLHV